MDNKYLKKLEYDKIVNILATYAQSDEAIDTILSIKPFVDINTINTKLHETSDAIDLAQRKGFPHFRGIKNVDNISKRLSIGGTLNNSELLVIKDNLYIARNVLLYLKESNPLLEDKENIITDLLSELVSVKYLEDDIRRCILTEEEIADEASPELQKIRRAIISAQAGIKSKLTNYIRSEKYKNIIQDTIITKRGDRYVIPIKRECKSSIKGVVHDTSASGATLYIEPMEVVEINNKVRELRVLEKEEIKKILIRLSNLTNTYIDEILNNHNILINGDCIFSKARFALEYDCYVPKINNNGYINLINARHPLIDKKQVVAIDFNVGKSFNALVITGPNTGGKTVSIKTVGLLTLMAQSGMAIPAQSGSEISVYDNVYADIGDEQSIEQNLSTFSSHLTNIIYILKNINQKSLVIFDELCAGTDPSEGSALALAIIENVMSKKSTLLATTHYSEIKMYASVTDNIENASCEFDVKTLSPTYKLLIGIPGKSNALYISKRLGLNHNIVESAKNFINNENTNYEDVLLALEKNRQKMEIEKNKSMDVRIELQNLKNQLENQRKNIDKEKQKVINKANKEAQKILEEATEKSTELLEQLNTLKKQGKISSNAKEEATLRKMLKDVPKIEQTAVTKKKIYNKDVPKDLKIGDSVTIIDMNQKATVLKLPDKKNQVLVLAGIMKVSIPLYNLSFDNKKIKTINTYSLNQNKKINLELDVRGTSLNEAEELVDKYIDDCFLAGLSEVQIIHGKGTGVLRAGIQLYLKKHSNVKSYRIGKYGEGESGVTVVTLK